MRNKQKAWRTQAVKAKRDHKAAGTHGKGSRYGRWVKSLLSAVSIKVGPSSLFRALGKRVQPVYTVPEIVA